MIFPMNSGKFEGKINWIEKSREGLYEVGMSFLNKNWGHAIFVANLDSNGNIRPIRNKSYLLSIYEEKHMPNCKLKRFMLSEKQ